MKCELLKIEQVIGQATVQSTIREALIVPDEKPGVEQVVSVDGTVRIRKIEIIEDKVIISGRLHVGVVYVAQRDDQPVHYTHGHIDFTEFAEIIGAMPGMTVHVNVRILDLQGEGSETHHHHHDDHDEHDHHGGSHLPPCQVGIIAVVEVSVKVTQTQEINVLVETDPGVMATTQRVRVEEIVAEAEQQTLVDGRFTVPDEKPGVERVLDVAAEIFITETKVVDGQALIEGEAVLQFMYVALRHSQPVHHMHHRLPFTQFVALPDLAGDMYRHAKLHVNVDEIVEHIGFDVIDGCTVKAELFLKKTVRVTCTRDVDIVTAITDSTSASYQGQTLQLEQVIGEDRTQILIKEEITVPDEKPGAAQVLDVKVVRVHIPREEIVLINDKVILGGIIHLKVIYVSVKENQSVHAVEARLKFRNFIAIPGAQPDMTALVNAVVEHATAHVRTGCDITVEIILKVTGRVVQTVCVDVVLCPVIAPQPQPTAPACPPGTHDTTVTVQPGDTIFRYAITYHVSVDHIIAANPGIDPNNLVVGSTVKIPCDP